MQRLLTAKDISAIIGCGINRAYQLMHMSTFPTIKIGSRMYVKPERFDEWLNRYTGRCYTV